MTDLYPNEEYARKINAGQGNIRYHLDPVDTTNVDQNLQGLRSMVGSLHHMKPEMAKEIL